jgi:hypothetical protein
VTHITAERRQATEVVLLLSADVETIEVIRSQIAERHLVAQDVKRTDQDRVRDGDRSAFT